MNFTKGAAADNLQDPILHWSHGYAMFWVLVVSLEVGAVALFWKLGFVNLNQE
jgi:Mg2+ and Co2+ transporter CorA